MDQGVPVVAAGQTAPVLDAVKEPRDGAYRARARIRDKDGVGREVAATGTTVAAAERALREKLVDRAPPTEQAITAETTIAGLAALWPTYLRDEDRIETTTINEYERVLTKVVIPELGGLRLREVTTSRLDLFLVPSARNALQPSIQGEGGDGGDAGFGGASRRPHGEPGPADVAGATGEIRDPSLTLEDLEVICQSVRLWTAKQRPGPKASSDMADIVDLMLATGARIGEILALRWVDVVLDAPQAHLTIIGAIKTEPGTDTYRKASPKSDSSVRTVALPDFAVALLQRRRRARLETPTDAVFPTRNGTWQQDTNVERRWREIRKDTGLEWVTPHTFRKTVATLIAERVDAETASQQLGHSSHVASKGANTFAANQLSISASTAEAISCFYPGKKW